MEKIIYHDHAGSDSSAGFKTVVEWLDRGFNDYGASVAVRFGRKELSYEELNQFSNGIANDLAGRGIERGDRVGICLDRSLEMIACIIGILKLGAAYIPLDPNYPADRLEMMREDAGLSLLITHQAYSGRFETGSGAVVVWEKAQNGIDHHSNVPPARDIDGEDTAYVIFTSGSTGRPKGIKMPHRGLSNLIEWQLERDYFAFGARVLQYSSISFDVSFQEIATTLASGGTLFLVRDEERRDPRLLLEVLNDFKIERLFMPFVALRSLIEVAVYTGILPGSLKEVITAGEQLRVDPGLRNFFSRLAGSVLDNQYGPSETHVISAHLLSGDPSKWPDLPPIGTPIKNAQIYILDDDMQPAGVEEPGELYLGGPNLAHGYIGRDDITRKSFIENPFEGSGGAAIYKTGDLGQYNDEGEIEFLGRVDHQVKILGYRIEPGEINAAGAQYPGISQCLTHAVQEEGKNPQLITYYAPRQDHKVDKKQFKTYLTESLPDYMAPAFVMELDAIPYTPSGKVDFKSLPQPEKDGAGSVEEAEMAYQSETEIKLAAIWSKLLNFKNIPRSASFFDLGGDSLNAVTLFMEIEKQFGKYLPLSSLTQAPTLEELSKIIDGTNDELDYGRFRALQLIRRGSVDNPPLFLVHGGAGNVLMFKTLAKGLPPDQSVYAFQWPGWDGYKGEDDIIKMAKFYMKELREAWPAGPYRLGGHCIGGIIAMEMARLLKAEGAEILGPVLVTDAPNLCSRHYHLDEPGSSMEEKTAFNRIAGNLESQIPVHAGKIEPRKKRSGRNNGKGRSRRFPFLAKILPFYSALAKKVFAAQDKLQLLKLSAFKKLSIKIPVQDRYLYCTRSQVAAIRKYEETIYEGDILYLKSEVIYGRQLGLRGWWDDIFFGFEELCSGRFDAHVIGGRHNEVLENDLALQIIRERMFELDA